jgi:hypothetical protein
MSNKKLAFLEFYGTECVYFWLKNHKGIRDFRDELVETIWVIFQGMISHHSHSITKMVLERALEETTKVKGMTKLVIYDIDKDEFSHEDRTFRPRKRTAVTVIFSPSVDMMSNWHDDPGKRRVFNFKTTYMKNYHIPKPAAANSQPDIKEKEPDIATGIKNLRSLVDATSIPKPAKSQPTEEVETTKEQDDDPRKRRASTPPYEQRRKEPDIATGIKNQRMHARVVMEKMKKFNEELEVLQKRHENHRPYRLAVVYDSRFTDETDRCLKCRVLRLALEGEDTELREVIENATNLVNEVTETINNTLNVNVKSDVTLCNCCEEAFEALIQE